MFNFFFSSRRRHTRSYGDWSSDVCSSDLVAYSDYTGYAPVNEPMDLRPGSHFDAATVRHPNRWQPLRYFDATGAVVTQSFVGAHWQHVAPFALTSVAQLRSPTGPAGYPAAAYESQ